MGDGAGAQAIRASIGQYLPACRELAPVGLELHIGLEWQLADSARPQFVGAGGVETSMREGPFDLVSLSRGARAQ